VNFCRRFFDELFLVIFEHDDWSLIMAFFDIMNVM